jgi:hypothetical protein
MIPHNTLIYVSGIDYFGRIRMGEKAKNFAVTNGGNV